VASVAVSFTPFVAVYYRIRELTEHFAEGRALDSAYMTSLGWMACGIAAAAVYFFAYRNEYRKTYTVAYAESEKMRLEVAERIRRLPLSFFNDKNLSELTTNIMGDCTSVEHTMSHVVPGLFADIVTAAIACVMLACYDWRMSAALFAALPVAFGLILLTKGIQKKFGERHVRAKLGVSEQVQEYLEGIKVIRAFGMAGEKSEALESALRRMMRDAVFFEGTAGIFATLAMMILQADIGIVTLIGVTLLTDGSIDAIKLLAFVLVSAKIYSPLIVILTLLSEFFYMLVSTKRMQSLRREPLMEGDENAVLPDCGIELKNVAFAYNDRDVIKNVSLKIPQNGVTALVGPSGSGKTTLSRLIARFWDAREGEILIGGRRRFRNS
jgi:ATP-binding cassette subfamily B protein